MIGPVDSPILGHNQLPLSPSVSDVGSLAAQLEQRLVATESNEDAVKFLFKHMGLVAQDAVVQLTSGNTTHTQPQDWLRFVVQALDQVFLRGENIHVAVQKLEMSTLDKMGIIQSYYAAVHVSGLPILQHTSGLLSPKPSQSTCKAVYATFGGQGINVSYLDELRRLFRTYRTLIEGTLHDSNELVLSLLHRANSPEIYTQGLSVMTWLESHESAPGQDYLSFAPVSFPLIGLLQLVSYEVTCKTLGLHPGQVQDSLSGTTGHSQGLIAAAVVAMADSWESWRTATRLAITSLFWLGLRAQQAFVCAAISPAMAKDSEMHDEGIPTPMLHLRGFEREEIQTQISKANKKLCTGSRLALALVNGAKNFVVSGAPIGLYGLNRQLRKLKQQDQRTRRYLPVSAPFHNNCLAAVPKIVQRDLNGISIHPSDLKVSLFCTKTGRDLKSSDSDLLPNLLCLILSEPLDWEVASAFPGATHIVDFGPGGVNV
ncbi:putative PKS/NRPS-like protein biosynthetic cluster [Fusarium chlamydosporum]